MYILTFTHTSARTRAGPELVFQMHCVHARMHAYILLNRDDGRDDRVIMVVLTNKAICAHARILAAVFTIRCVLARFTRIYSSHMRASM